jgi:hypothetical protein
MGVAVSRTSNSSQNLDFVRSHLPDGASSTVFLAINKRRTRLPTVDEPVSALLTHPSPNLYRDTRLAHREQLQVHQEIDALKTVFFALYSRASPWMILHQCAESFLALVQQAGSQGLGVTSKVEEGGFEEVMEAVLKSDGVLGGRVVELRCVRSLKTFH